MASFELQLLPDELILRIVSFTCDAATIVCFCSTSKRMFALREEAILWAPLIGKRARAAFPFVTKDEMIAASELAQEMGPFLYYRKYIHPTHMWSRYEPDLEWVDPRLPRVYGSVHVNPKAPLFERRQLLPGFVKAFRGCSKVRTQEWVCPSCRRLQASRFSRGATCADPTCPKPVQYLHDGDGVHSLVTAIYEGATAAKTRVVVIDLDTGRMLHVLWGPPLPLQPEAAVPQGAGGPHNRTREEMDEGEEEFWSASEEPGEGEEEEEEEEMAFAVAGHALAPHAGDHADLEQAWEEQLQLHGNPQPHRLSIRFPLVAVGFTNGRTKIYDMQTGAECSELFHRDPSCIWMVQFAAPSHLLTLQSTYFINVWTLAEGGTLPTYVKTINAGHDDDYLFYMSLEGDNLITVYEDGLIRLYSMASGACLHSVHQHDSTVGRANLVNNTLLTSSFDGRISIWKLDKDRLTLTWMSPVADTSISGLWRSFDLAATMTMSTWGPLNVHVWDLSVPALMCKVNVASQDHDSTSNSSMWFDGTQIVFTNSRTHLVRLKVLDC